MKILITGGSGFLGRNLIERLKSEGHDISCLDRYLAPFLEEYGVRTIQGDIYEQVAVDEAVRGMDVVFVTTAKTHEEARELLTLFNMPFRKN